MDFDTLLAGNQPSATRQAIAPEGLDVIGVWVIDNRVLPICRLMGQNGAMTSEELLERIVVDPEVCFGKPTIRGHRIWVSLVLGYLAEGWTPEQVVEEYPGIEIDDVRACVAYAARLADVRFVDLDDVA